MNNETGLAPKRTVIITGGDSQLAKCIMHIAGKQKDPPDVEYIALPHSTLDICDEKNIYDVLSSYDTLYCVINCAAYTDVAKAETDSETAYAVNAEGVKNLVNVCNKLKCPLIHISTDYVYDGTANIPYTEKIPANPVNKYGGSKLLGETYITSMSHNWIILRTGWLYSNFGTNFYTKIMDKIQCCDVAIDVTTNEVGTPTSAYDVAAAIIGIVDAGYITKKYNGIYNISDEGVCSWYDFAWMINHLYGLQTIVVNPVILNKQKSSVTRPSYAVLDKTKFYNKFHFSEMPHWIESLKSLIIDSY